MSYLEEAGFASLLALQAQRHGGRTVYSFLADGETESTSLTYGELDGAVQRLAARLARRCAPGERALLVYPPGLDFVVAFLACLRAGIVAVPVHPPRPRTGAGPLARFAEDARPTLVLGTEDLLARLGRSAGETVHLGAARWIPTDATVGDDDAAAAWRGPAIRPDDVAFLQYTSGSTSVPRGVRVTHANLAANQRAIQAAFGQSEESVVVSWLPPYHDMGLIGTILQPLWCGGRAVLMAPLAFLHRPRRWLEAVTRHRATTTGGPDFAWSLAVRRVPPEERDGLDLSSLRVAFSGAEPVRPATLETFARAFAPCGFRREAFFPCYGLAEATLFVTGGEVDVEPVVRRAPAAVAGTGPAAAEKRLAGSGRPREVQLRVVDPERRRPVAVGEEGEIWLAGPAVADGYWNRPEETARTFGARLADGSGPFLRTGDLGLVDEDGELFVTGRRKDLLIVRGRNLHPHDLEATVEAAHPALRPAGAAAFPVEVAGEERVVVACEVERRREEEAPEVVRSVEAALVAAHEVAPHEVVALRAGTLPRTTSGKVRRHACRRNWEEGTLHRLAAAGTAAGGGTPGAVDAAAAPKGVQKPGTTSPDAVARRVAEVSGRVPRAGEPIHLDSLQAVELAWRLETELGVVLSLEVLLAAPTPEQLAERAGTVGGGAPEVAGSTATVKAGLPPVGAGSRFPATAEGPPPTTGGIGPSATAETALPRRPPLPRVSLDPGSRHPVSDAQRALWLHERLDSSGQPLVLACAARLRRMPGATAESPRASRLTGAEVEGALAALVARHASLHTRFPAEGGEPVQEIFDPGPADGDPAGGGSGAATPGLDFRALDFRALDLGAVDASEASGAALEEALAAAITAPFDLARGPLVRARWLTGGPASRGGSLRTGSDGEGEAWDGLLVLVVHHLVADFSSLDLLLDELAAELVETPSRPASDDARASHAAWVRGSQAELEGLRGAHLVAWWRRELEGAPTVLDLPVDRPRPSVAGRRGGSFPFRLEGPTAAGVEALARSCGVTPFAVLLAAWQWVLGRWAGATDLLVGTAVSGRSPELAGVVGHFADLLPLRRRLAADASFRVHATGTGRRLAAALEHRGLPFPRLVEALAPPRDPSRHPLVQAGIVLESPRRPAGPGLSALSLGEAGPPVRLGATSSDDGPKTRPPVLELEPVLIPARTVELELLLMVVEERSGRGASAYAAALQYAADLFEASTVERLAGAWRRALEAAVADPDLPLRRLPLLSAEAAGQRLSQPAEDSLPTFPDLVEAFYAGAAAAPEAPAVLFRSEGGGVGAFSYGETATRVTDLARHLREQGVGPEVPVAVLLDRVPARPVAMLAVLAAGGFFVALEPSDPPGRHAELLAASGAGLVISGGAALAALPDGPWRTLELPAGGRLQPDRPDRGEPAPARSGPALARPVGGSSEPAEARPPGTGAGAAAARPDPFVPAAITLSLGPAPRPPFPPPPPEVAAYVVFTSGSTGTPKGVVVPRRAVAALVASAGRDLGLGSGRRQLHFAALSFDISVAEVLMPLANGAAVALASEEARRSGRVLAAQVRAFGASDLILTPSVLGLLPEGEDLPSLRALCVGGEVCPRDLAERWAAAGRRLFNAYGPSETTVYSTLSSCPPGRPERMALLGDPIAGTRLALVDRHGGEALPGSLGEVHLGGAGVARGYLGRPAATAERFVPDPGPSHPGSPRRGARRYRTGDLARRRTDGGITFAGRADAQLKIRGVRLEPAEVEAALVALPAVAAAAVDVRGERLVAWLVPAGEALPGTAELPGIAELRRALAGRLPAPLVPTRFVALPGLPLTRNGKVDRSALVLPAPVGDAAAATAPRGELERTIAELWGRHLGLERVPADVSFFDLGGHSLALARVHEELCRALGREVALPDLFSHATVASLAAHLSGDGEGDHNGAEARATTRRGAMEDRRRRRQGVVAGAVGGGE